MLTTSKQMLIDASKNGYAVPAINTQGGNYDIIWAICKAAEDLHSPVILAHYVSTGAYSGNGARPRFPSPWPSIWTTAMGLTSVWNL